METQELWQVEVEGRFYEASFDEMIQWIKEGALLPEDLVRHGSLRWLEARKVPLLNEHFLQSEERKEIEPPENIREVYTNFQVEEVEAEKGSRPFPRISNYTAAPSEKINGSENGYPQTVNETDKKVCYFHSEGEPFYYCGICSSYFCKKCPNSFGSVKLCPLCGGMCDLYKKDIEFHVTHGSINKPYKRVKAETEAVELPPEPGLTLKDLIIAAKFPLRFPLGFLVELIIFTATGIGIGCLLIEGSVMYVIGVSSLIVMVILQFGELSKTIENLWQNDIHTSYMPHINRFSVVEEFLHPGVMGFAAYLVSFGLFIVMVGSTVLFINYQFSNQLDSAESEIRLKNNELDLKIMAEKVKSGAVNKNINQTDLNQAKIDEMINQSKEEQSNTIFGDNHLGDNGGITKLINSFMRLSIYFQMPIFITFLMGILYFPIACAIAGSTRMIKKILNPVFGFKTVKRLGFDYIKILSLFLIFALILFGTVLGVLMGLSSLHMPIIGIFLSIAIGSVFLSYFWLVYSEFLGIAVSRKLVVWIEEVEMV